MCDVVNCNQHCSYSGTNGGFSGFWQPVLFHESVLDDLTQAVCAVSNPNSIDPKFASPGRVLTYGLIRMLKNYRQLFCVQRQSNESSLLKNSYRSVKLLLYTVFFSYQCNASTLNDNIITWFAKTDGSLAHQSLASVLGLYKEFIFFFMLLSQVTLSATLFHIKGVSFLPSIYQIDWYNCLK